MGSICPYNGRQPTLGRDVFVAAGAWLIGDVTVGDESSIWFNCVLRGDINRIQIGRCTNLQDGVVCHVGEQTPCVVGDYVTVGHRAILHGCTVGDEVLVGMGAVVMDGVVIGAQSIIGAGALLTEGVVVPSAALVYGAPAKVVSRLGEKERQQIRQWAEQYCALAAVYRCGS